MNETKFTKGEWVGLTINDKLYLGQVDAVLEQQYYSIYIGRPFYSSRITTVVKEKHLVRFENTTHFNLVDR